MRLTRLTATFVASFILIFGLLTTVGLNAQDEKPPDEIVYEAKMGNVTFSHTAHVKAANGKCETCHDKLFPKSRGDINFKQGMHKPAEAAKTSCGGCHHPGGPSFETKGNCTKCHVKK